MGVLLFTTFFRCNHISTAHLDTGAQWGDDALSSNTAVSKRDEKKQLDDRETFRLEVSPGLPSSFVYSAVFHHIDNNNS